MEFLGNINLISILITGMFFIPFLTGMLYPITSSRIQHSMLSMLNNLKLILGIILSASLTRIVFFDEKSSLSVFLYQFKPIKDLIFHYRYDIAAYIIAMFVFFAVVLFALEILTIPLHRFVIIQSANKISPVLNSMNVTAKRLLSGAWTLPKSFCMVLIFTLLLSFYSNYINNPSTDRYINQSKAYQLIQSNILLPILSTETAKRLPVLISDSFKKAAEDYTPANNDNGGDANYWKLPVIKYFNGMTLDEAVKSNSKIDNTAKKIVGTEEDAKTKAYLLYKWVSKNIEYDRGKAEIIDKDSSHVNSGSIVTYSERKGVCFDYSCLYISMCRAVGLKVRFVTGLGYNGVGWGDHAWNQVYIPEEKRWINVDTTFGSAGLDSFDNSDFSTYHKYDVIQSEW